MIRDAIQLSIQSIVEEESKLAASRVETRIKERVALIAATVMQRCSMEPYGPKGLKIIIDFNEPYKGKDPVNEPLT